MPRTITITTSPDTRNRIAERLRDQPGIASVTLHRGAAMGSDDDVLTVDLTNNAALDVIRLLDAMGVLEAGSVTVSEPSVVISSGDARPLDEEGNEAIWEEVGSLLRRESNLSINYLLLMTLSGAVAAFGLVTDTLHVVIGAMLIAPGFAPLLRIAFGALGHRGGMMAGIKSTAAGYLLLAFGAALGMALALALHGNTVSDLTSLHWVNYWSKVEATGVATSLIAGIAGGVITSSRQTVFATGVMIALALVPSMALVGMGLGAGNVELAIDALGRWAVEAFCVLSAGGITLAAKKRLLHRRKRVGPS
ncbi:DUF389 domain-containing protein [Skermanella mucosa]|uniref:DUF389 domain-containing protein n=1 Tax=Skermanella mucosa TaxID=1789672 RepID=UPI00192B80D5|nr:DUF389 domain-containing protein [Skermanella mucosa]UEM22261.1 DUF389 domain-containing protein [Skermanella mucosa]